MSTLVAGLYGGDLVNHIGAVADPTKHRIAPAGRVGEVWFRNVLLATLMKNCAVAE